MPNTELFDKIKEHIRNEPRSISMDTWYSKSSRTACGTEACIAGTALMLCDREQVLKDHNEAIQYADISGVAAELLGIPSTTNLFHSCTWPDDLSSKLANSTAEEYPEVVIEAIDSYLLALEKDEHWGDGWDDEDDDSTEELD